MNESLRMHTDEMEYKLPLTIQQSEISINALSSQASFLIVKAIVCRIYLLKPLMRQSQQKSSSFLVCWNV